MDKYGGNSSFGESSGKGGDSREVKSEGGEVVKKKILILTLILAKAVSRLRGPQSVRLVPAETLIVNISCRMPAHIALRLGAI